VVLPASGCEMIAKVRRRAVSWLKDMARTRTGKAHHCTGRRDSAQFSVGVRGAAQGRYGRRLSALM
jgi:hypothetical protein